MEGKRHRGGGGEGSCQALVGAGGAGALAGVLRMRVAVRPWKERGRERCCQIPAIQSRPAPIHMV